MRIIDESSAQTPVDRTRALRCLQATCVALVVTNIVMAATIGSAITNLKKQADSAEQKSAVLQSELNNLADNQRLNEIEADVRDMGLAFQTLNSTTAETESLQRNYSKMTKDHSTRMTDIEDTLQSEVTQSIADRQRLNQRQADLMEIIAAFEMLNATVAQVDSDGQEGRSMIQQNISNITTQLQSALATAQLQQTRIEELDLFRANSTEATEDHYTRITNLEDITLPKDCSDIRFGASIENGTFTIYPYGKLGDPLLVYCLSDSDGTWTVIQRRFNGSVDFYQKWYDYKTGFGSVDGEYWLGNDIIYALTTTGNYEIKILLTDFDDTTKYARYSTFRIDDEVQGYNLTIESYSGDAGDSMTHHSGMKFTTLDIDNDIRPSWNCAYLCKGGWWYRACYESNLNGLFTPPSTNPNIGITWVTWHGYMYSLKSSTMMIKKK